MPAKIPPLATVVHTDFDNIANEPRGPTIPSRMLHSLPPYYPILLFHQHRCCQLLQAAIAESKGDSPCAS